MLLDLKVPLEYVTSSASTPKSNRVSIVPVRKIKAIKFVEALKEGLDIHEAARKVGTKARYMVNDPDVQFMAKELIAKYTLDADTRRKLSRAKTNQLVLEGENKDAINALKILNDDPEVGIGGQPAAVLNQQFNLSPATASLLQSFEVEEGESISPGATPNLIDAPADQDPA